jgi:hypothetical protein
MKKLFIAGNAALATTPATLAAINAAGIGAGKIALYDNTGAIITGAVTSKPEYMSLFVGVGALADAVAMFSEPKIELKNYKIVKSVYVAGTKFTASVTIPTPITGNDYTLVMTKKGTVFNERYNYTATSKGQAGMTASQLAQDLAVQLNNQGLFQGFAATVAGAVITVTAKDYQGWSLSAGDDLYGVSVSVTPAVAPINDDAYIQDLYRQCQGDFGHWYTDPVDGFDYVKPTIQNAGGWTLYTFYWDDTQYVNSGNNEMIKQELNVAIPTGAAQIATLDTIIASL